MNEFSPSVPAPAFLLLNAQISEAASHRAVFRRKAADTGLGLGRISPSHLISKHPYLNMAKVNILIVEMGTVGQPRKGTSRS